ncbi:F1F0 ATP synthase assembly Atp10 [Pyrrhoderma noxium]|uniref:F1F0 ATP synthase assembly Atp10 n=1 Tax=Pyrrhoderma noxium TaxID=2282107 RepID=A0A286U704_9AGAM|nr:F1F0 ATP synthase assembly Atp10 [Pyrrhoderma noxium]
MLPRAYATTSRSLLLLNNGNKGLLLKEKGVFYPPCRRLKSSSANRTNKAAKPLTSASVASLLSNASKTRTKTLSKATDTPNSDSDSTSSTSSTPSTSSASKSDTTTTNTGSPFFENQEVFLLPKALHKAGKGQQQQTFDKNDYELVEEIEVPAKFFAENPNLTYEQLDELLFPTLPYLPHPLGVDEPPTTYQKSWKESTLELMDQNKRMAQRKHIIKEATRGYFADLNATRKNGGKSWVAPKTLIRKDAAKYFPNIYGRTLASADIKHTAEMCKGKISVIALISTMVSNEHANSFIDLTHTQYHTNPYYNYIQINLEDNIAKAFLRTMYINSLRRQTPLALHGQYMLSGQNMEYLREPLGIGNRHVGYVYLVDADMKVRWAGGGLALKEEAESLRACTGVLLSRMGRGGVEASGK